MMSTSRVLIMAGGIFGLLGVVAGAMGVHALRDALGARALSTCETAVRVLLHPARVRVAGGPRAGALRANGRDSFPAGLLA